MASSCQITSRPGVQAFAGRTLTVPRPASRFAVQQLPASPAHSRRPQRAGAVVTRAESRDNGGFLAGFVVGGVVFGALGFLFAPQISAALLSEDQRLKLPKFLEDEDKSPEATKQDLADKIAQLNSAIDDVSAQLKAQDQAATVEQPTVA